jgi:signal transduction histidine kinase
MIITSFGDVIAERLRAEHATLATRWFDRLLTLLPVDAGEVFPDAGLLDHIPSLIVDISEYLRAPEAEAIAANTTVLEKAHELGALRHEQHASLHQVLREYQLLGSVLVTFVQEEIDRLALTPTPVETVRVVSLLHAAVNVLMQATVETFVGLYMKTIADQAERLEQFTRMATHEWRQPLSSLRFAAEILRRADPSSDQAKRTLDVLDRNITHLIDMTRKVEVLARIGTTQDGPVLQEVSVSTVAAEAARQLRDMAEARGVDLRIDEGGPLLTVDVGRLELVLLNLMSNGIKYSDPGKPVRFVEVTGRSADAGHCEIVVRDNGIGIPDDRVATIFDRFSRAHSERDDALNVTGMGLGLAIVADSAVVMSGEIEVRSTEMKGTEFLLRLPTSPRR